MKAVPVLLKHLMKARSKFHERGRDESFDGKLEKLRLELSQIKKVFVRVKKNEEELLDRLAEVDGHLRKLDRKSLYQDTDAICERISDCVHKLLPKDDVDDSSEEEGHKRSEIQRSSRPSSEKHKNQLLLPKQLHTDLHILEVHEQHCLFSLLVFPEGAIIKKKHTIYWWIGEGLLKYSEDKTAEEEGEDVMDKLFQSNVIVPYGNGKCPIVNKFQINPVFRPGLLLRLREKYHSSYAVDVRTYYSPLRGTWLVLEQQKVIVGNGDSLNTRRWIDTIFNVGASYLNFGSNWLDKNMYNLKVLQLGRWQDSPSHHIEVGSEEFLKKLLNQKDLTYISLRGISRISKLPPSIAQLESLQILDLKACHNLETLPNDISSMKSLTHLILSQCYLLESMPKGIQKLTQLQVLKGFLKGNPRKTPYTVSDLATLKNLRQLSIHLGSEVVIKDGEFESLGELPALEHLKISWGVSDTRYSDIKMIFPSSLKKLHLEGFRGQKIPEWLKPSKMPKGCQELKIVGGELRSMNYDEDKYLWGMEIVHLKYLKHLKVDIAKLTGLFPFLKYAEIKQISNHSYLEWSIV
ncbi:unnamed protein product [Sphenostylis stenocarpa]|uniref:Disease resistance RPP13-like protein 4 n=1 Tax=Sphenostylis stenocarpa TaxID=92480 RepID=A0AA86S0M0_9FABA|nr:unnamed protein product [Sphenostylis stenocarpa]